MSWILGLVEAVVWLGLGLFALIVLVLCWAYLVLTYFRHYGVYRCRPGAVAAYTRARSFVADAPIPLHVHTDADAELRVYRLGTMREDTGYRRPVTRAAQSARYHVVEGLDWPANVEIPAGTLQPGFHAAEIVQTADPAKSFRVPLIVRPPAPPDIAVILPTNTWEAYNEFGGVSAYVNRRYGRLTRKILWEIENIGYVMPQRSLPWARPNTIVSDDLAGVEDPFSPYATYLPRNDWAMLAFLERAGYEYGVYCDHDLAFLPDPRRAKLMVFAGHSEYWPQEMFGAFESYVRAGGHVLISASCMMVGRAAFADTGLTDLAHDRGAPSDYIYSHIGTRVTEYGEHRGAAPMRVERADHWIFDGTGLADGDLFGGDGAALGNPDGADSGGASGRYQSKIGRGSGGFDVLATGTNEHGPAQMAFRETDAGGWVFNTSSATFAGILDRDESGARIIRNLVDNALGRR